MTKLPSYLSLSLLASLSLSSVALAEASSSKVPTMPRWQDTKVVSSSVSTAATDKIPAAIPASTKPESKTFNSDGTVVTLDDLGFAITPPAGWEVTTYAGTLSLIMREPKVETPSYDKPKYQRNITMAVKSNGSPIDEKRAKELETDLSASFSKDPSVSNFQIMEHKFFNFRGENDALLVYSSLNIGEYRMMQMHVLVSGAENQFLMTYTDLADRFSDAADPVFPKAWSSMVSAGLKGETPARANDLIRYSTMGGGAFLLLAIAMILRRKATKKDYASQADALFDDGDTGMNGTGEGSMIATIAQGWKIGKARATQDDNNGLLFSSAAGIKIGRTQPSEFVSSF